jgi:hypothetical protein
MKSARRFLFVSMLGLVASCGGGGGGGGDAPPPPPPPNPLAPVITGPGSILPIAVIGVPISPVTFTATGTAPINWSVTGGTLPPGLTVSPSGVLSGTPTFAGSFFFIVTATDANGSDSEGFTQAVGTTATENEPNNDAASANPLDIGSAGTGVITADDIDFWSFPATEDQVVRIELFAIRREFSSWDTNANRPRLTLVGPNGTDFLLGHDFSNGGSAGWQWGNHDLDIPMFRIPADGDYYVRVESTIAGIQGGSYAVLVTDVTPPSLQEESETNDDAATANAITPGTVWAMKDDDNDDWFSFDITEETLVYLEITGYRNGVYGIGGSADDDYFDPTIELIDADESSVRATSYQVFFSDPALHYHLVTPGTYFLRVTESSNGTDGDGAYFITFTATPVGSIAETETNNDTATATPIAYGDVVSGSMDSDDDFYSFSGTAGDIVRVFWFEGGASETATDFLDMNFMIDDSTILQRAVQSGGVNAMACMRAILPSTGTFYVRVQPAGGPTSYVFQLVLFKNSTYETEGNDTIGVANAFPGSGRVSGAIDVPGDVDIFSFTAQAGDIITFSIYAGAGSSSDGFSSHSKYTTAFAALFPDLEVVNDTSNSLGVTPYSGTTFSGESVTNGLATSELTFVPILAGTYYIQVTASDGAGDSDHRYVLERR